MVELAADCSTKCSVTSALMNSGGGLSSAIAGPPYRTARMLKASILSIPSFISSSLRPLP
jgi:hypothetical protein